jgi:AraC family transcriptional regulator
MEQPRIMEITPRKLIGMHIETSLSENKIRILWSSFMPVFKKAAREVSYKLYSIQIFDENIKMSTFNPNTRFIKWAAVEERDVRTIPEIMENFTLPGGLYVVFIHKGPAHTFPKTSQYIFGQWLPNSKYELDNRPHFEIMDENYPGPDNPEVEEEVWIPVKMKSEA